MSIEELHKHQSQVLVQMKNLILSNNNCYYYFFFFFNFKINLVFIIFYFLDF